MTIKFTTPVGGHRLDKQGRMTGIFNYAIGDETDWPNDVEARRMIERGIATEVKKSNTK